MKKLLIGLLVFNLNIVMAQTDSEIEIKPLKNRTYFDISGGLSSRLGKAQPTNDFDLDRKISISKRGFFVDASLFFQVKPNSNHFIGFKYNSFNNYLNNNKLSISFYGVSYLFSKEFYGKDLLNADVSFGYITYKDNQYFIDNYVIKGGNVGIKTNLYYLLKISKGFYSGPKIGLQLASAKDFKVENKVSNSQDINLKDVNESLSTLDIGIVFRISL